MNTGHNNAAAIAVDIAKGWKPNYYLTNMAMIIFSGTGNECCTKYLSDPTSAGKYRKLLYFQQGRDCKRSGKEKA